MTTTMKRIRLRLFSGAILCGILQNGQAALNAVDPGPYTADTGFFPHWYQDTQAVVLDLCLSTTVSNQVPPATPPAYMCTILPKPASSTTHFRLYFRPTSRMKPSSSRQAPRSMTRPCLIRRIPVSHTARILREPSAAVFRHPMTRSRFPASASASTFPYPAPTQSPIPTALRPL